jgi:hypothetical protein
VKEGEIWLRIAEDVECNNPGYFLGLCERIQHYRVSEYTRNVRTIKRMDARLQLFRPNGADDFDYWWSSKFGPTNPSYRESEACRVLAACFLAAMSDA